MRLCVESRPKHNKKTSLTKMAKKGLELKQGMTEELRPCVDTHQYLFIFSVASVKNGKLNDIRNAWKHSNVLWQKRNDDGGLGSKPS